MLILNHSGPPQAPVTTGPLLRNVARCAPCRAVPSTTDMFGFVHGRTNAAATAAFERAVLAVAAHKPLAAAALAQAVDADRDLVAAHALQGFAQVILGRAEMLPVVRATLQEARRALASRGGSFDERVLVSGLAEAVEGRFAKAAERLEVGLDTSPTAFLTAKIAHSLRFMIGDAAGMLATTARVLDAWSPHAPGYGFLLGCHAFALEELGEYRSAERVGCRAVEIEPEDAWGLHAVSHVHEMQGRTREGIAWLESARPVWGACNNFGFHMAWHLALFHLELGDHARVLQLYDAEVRPYPTDDFRDVANAASLLWRLDNEGVAVGHRWDELRDIARSRRCDVTLAFAALHNVLTLVAVGDHDAARSVVGAMRAKADAADGDQAAAMDAVAIDLATALLDLATHQAPRSDFDRLAARLHRIGGSNAQRDVFVGALAAIAANRGDGPTLQRILAARRTLKKDDRFADLVQRWCAQARRGAAVPLGYSRRTSTGKRPGISGAPVARAS